MQKPEENKPLAGVNIILTRAVEQAGADIEVLKNYGADVILYPTIKTVLCRDVTALVTAINKIRDFDYLIFTSVNTVKFFFEVIGKIEKSVPEEVKLIAVGDKTAEALRERGYTGVLIPDEFTAEGVIKLLETQIDGKNVLLPQSAIARKILREKLAEYGAAVTVISLYETVMPDDTEVIESREKLRNIKSGLFIFTSPSTFDNFLKLEQVTNPGEYFSKFQTAVIGSVTRARLEESGVKVDIIPDVFNMENLIKHVIDYYKK